MHAQRRSFDSAVDFSKAIVLDANLGGNQTGLSLRVVAADGAPYAFKGRWIEPAVVPDTLNETFSANEWLLKHTPYTHDEIKFPAYAATRDETAAMLQCTPDGTLVTIDRVIWDIYVAITNVRLLSCPGHQICTDLWRLLTSSPI